MSYLASRGDTPGPLFLFTNGQPLTRTNLTDWLRQIMAANQIPGNFSSHSFRIGAATVAALACSRRSDSGARRKGKASEKKGRGVGRGAESSSLKMSLNSIVVKRLAQESGGPILYPIENLFFPFFYMFFLMF